jgi:hypothetical protein
LRMGKLLDADNYALGRAKTQRNSACTEYRFAHIGVWPEAGCGVAAPVLGSRGVPAYFRM